MATPVQRLANEFLSHIAGMNGGSTLAMSATGTWPAYSFVLESNKTLSAVELYCTAVGGTLGASDFTCDVYSNVDATGIPNASLASSATVTTTPTGALWVEWTGFSLSLTAGVQYWLVFKNVNGTPGTNFPTVYRSLTQTIPNRTSLQTTGWNYVATINSGSAWTTNAAINVSGPRLQFSDGTYAGLPVQSGAATTSGNGCFGVQEAGFSCTLPANFKGNVAGIKMGVTKTGTPGTLTFKLYNGTTLLGTTYTIAAAAVSGAGIYTAFFATPIPIDSSMTLHAMAVDGTSGDTSASRYNLWNYITQNDANSKFQKPFDGTMSRCIIPNNAANPVVPADTDTDFVLGALLLDTNGELNAGPSPRGILVGGTM